MMRSLATATTASATKPASTRRPLSDVAEHVAGERQTRPWRTAILLAAIASFLWLAVSVATIYLLVRYLPPTEVTLVGLGGIAAGITAPLTAIWLVALMLARAAPGETRTALNRIAAAEAHFSEVTARTRREIDAIDGVLTAVAARVEDVRQTLATQAESLVDAAGYLELRTAAISGTLGRDKSAILALLEQLSIGSTAANAELANVINTLPLAQQQALAIQALIGDSAASARTQISEVDLLLGSVAGRHEDLKARAEVSADQLRATLAAINAESTATAEQFGAQSARLETSVDAAMTRASDALDAARKAVDIQVEAVVTATGQAKAILTDLGQTTARTVNDQLAVMATEAERLTAELVRHEALSGDLVESYGRSFGVLDAKLSNAAQSSVAIFDGLSLRLQEFLTQVHGLSSPLEASADQTRALETAVAAMHDSITASVVTLSSTLPDSLAATGSAVDGVRASVDALGSEIDATSSKAAAVAQPVESSRSAIAAAADALSQQRDGLDTLMSTITARLTTANKLVGEIEQGTDAAALAATTKLLEALVRARDVAAQAEGAMREALDRAILDSRTSLAAAGDAAMRTSFTDPVIRQLSQLTAASEASADAARGAGERLSRQMLAVLETATLVETRIQEADVRLEDASRQDMSRRATLLIDALNSASIDIAKALAIDVSDSSWTAYLRGDRSIFTRRSVKLLDRGTAKAIVRQYETEPEFRDSVRRYVNDFEQLMRSVAGEREASSLQITLLASDTGKLYVALAQALERIRN